MHNTDPVSLAMMIAGPLVALIAAGLIVWRIFRGRSIRSPLIVLIIFIVGDIVGFLLVRKHPYFYVDEQFAAFARDQIILGGALVAPFVLVAIGVFLLIKWLVRRRRSRRTPRCR